jgi:hypothetical protein
MYDKIELFLTKQKQRLLEMDGASEKTEWLTEKELSGRHFVGKAKTGAPLGMMSILYENTIDWLLSEARGVLRLEFMDLMAPGAISEDTLSTAFSTFTTSLLPAVRRVYANLIAMELVSVQPLTGPSGYIYWLDHTYHSTTGDATATHRLDEHAYKTYADGSEQGTIPEINFQLKSKLISTISQKLKADWTIEGEQDLRSQWKLDLESEIMPEVSNELVRETDRKILAALLAGAANNVNWNYNGFLAGDTTLGTWGQKAYKETLYEAIIDANTYIFKKKYTNADYCVMDADVYARVQKLQQFVIDPLAINQQANMGRMYVGTLSNLFKVYVDPWFTANTILLGIKGTDWKKACAYYAPYIPLFMSDKYIISDDFTQFSRGAMSRYAYGVLPETYDQSPVKNNGLATVTLTAS